MTTCKTCKWWRETDFSTGFHPTLEEQIRRKETTTRRCGNSKLMGETDCYGKLNDAALAFPTAADDYAISFQTGSDFGCIHHETA